MTPQLYTKLTDQIARQAPELAAYEAQIAALQPGVDAAADTVATLEAALADATPALEAALSRPEDAPQDWQPPACEAEHAQVAAVQRALDDAKAAHSKAKAPVDDLTARASALRSAMDQCTAALQQTGMSMTPEEINLHRLGTMRASLWERIKATRDRLKAGGVKVGTKWFHSDPDSRIQQLGLVMMGASVPAVQWKTMDGGFIAMSQALAGQIFAATAASDMALFARAEALRAQVEASADPVSVDIGAGWPETFTG